VETGGCKRAFSVHHLEKVCIHIAMGFAVTVEALNLEASRKRASGHEV
jgi:hypothetical protein